MMDDAAKGSMGSAAEEAAVHGEFAITFFGFHGAVHSPRNLVVGLMCVFVAPDPG